MEVAGDTPHQWDYQGKRWHFCSARCRDQFVADPGAYREAPAPEGEPEHGRDGHGSHGRGEPPTHVHHDHGDHGDHHHHEQRDEACATARCDTAATWYLCPMHPEVRQAEPGSCPKCGMALEPVLEPAAVARMEYVCPMHPEVVLDHPGSCPKCGMALEPRTTTVEERNPELEQMSRRFWVGVGLALPVFALAMVADLVPRWIPAWLDTGTLEWIECILATPVVLWAGWPFFVRGWASVRSRSLNMFTLIALGVGTAWLYSMAGLLFPTIFPPDMIRPDGTVAVYFEAAAVITVLVLLGQVLELRARSGTNAAIRALLDLAPKTARRVQEDGTEADVPLEQVTAGDTLRVRPGEKIPVDGTVLEGESHVDESMESAGVTLVKGDLRGIVRALRLSRATMRNIRQNLFFAFVYNGLGVPLAAGALYPFFGLLLSPMIAAAAMSFSSVSVIGNALRLKRVTL